MGTHGSPELDEDAEKLLAMGADPGPTFLTLDDLCSPGYRAQLNEMAVKRAWAGGGKAYVDELLRLCLKCEAKSVIDYGCGFVDMTQEISQLVWGPVSRSLHVQSYDPGIPGRERLPEPADVVFSVDVLEHIEPDKLQNVLNHIYSLTVKCALLVVAIKPAEKRLPDGRNAHLIIDNAGWWMHQLRDLGDWKCRVIDDGRESGLLHMWWRKRETTSEGTIA